MAENEALFIDERFASELTIISERLEAGQPIDAFIRDVQDEFRNRIRAILKSWAGRGVILDQFVNAILESPEKVMQLIKQTRYDSYALLLRSSVAGRQTVNPNIIIESFISAVWSLHCEDLSLKGFATLLDSDYKKQIGRFLRRISHSLVRNPTKLPRRSRSRNARLGIDAQLSANLLS